VKRPSAPLSLRLTVEERQSLEARAGGLPVSTYVKRQLFGDERRSATRFRRVSADQALVAKLLSVLGQSRIAPNLDLLASQARAGNLFADAATTRQLLDACDDVRLMHNALMRALGMHEKAASSREMRAAAEFNEAARADEDDR